MITDSLMDIVFGMVESLLNLIPDISIPVNISALKPFLDIIGTVLYFFPWQKVLPIIGIIFLLQVWRLIVTIIKTIWDVLPLV